MKNQVLDNPVKNQTADSFTPLTVIACLLAAFYLTANIMAVKVISIGGVALFDAGTVTFPFAYMLGDALTEVWGFRTAKKVIFLTFVCNIILVAATALGLVLPAPDYMAETTAAYAARLHLCAPDCSGVPTGVPGGRALQRLGHGENQGKNR